MNFYEVWVRSNHYHGHGALTYSSNLKLNIGQLIIVPLKDELVTAIVLNKVAKPTIKIKSIASIPSLPALPSTSLLLLKWLKSYYPAPVGIITQQFIPAGINNSSIALGHTPNKLSSNIKTLPILSPEQKTALEQIKTQDTYLLHGRTGSGKTRIYLELTENELNNGRSVIILTPEISLTTQLEAQFSNIYKDQVILLHSNLTPKQRLERWIRILHNSGPTIVIGPRSVIFSPLKNIGLIIVDEEHEPAYKQEQSPYYQTTKVASQLRNIHNAKLILGSATPLVSDYFLAKSRSKPIIRLKSLAKQTTLPPLQTTLVDCRERSLFNRSGFFSQPLIETIQNALSNNYQTLLYLNRRGTARVIICDQCDWQAHCPKCDLPFTYHGDSHNLRCHVCGYITEAPTTCPNCNNLSVKYLSIGTKAVVNEVSRLFPTAKVQRFDADNLKADRIEQHYQAIKNGSVDIIVGTQMLAKGLDLPKLAVVGVLLADTSLQLPDYTVNERTYELLQQVVGRVGRGHIKGHAIIQTYQTNNPLITQALNDNWDEFYAQELKERQQFAFPPFVHLLKLSLLRASPKSAEAAATKLALSMPSTVKVEGPAPAFHEKQSNKFKWQLVIKATQRSSLLAIISQLPTNVTYDIDPSNLI
jgi:primosomal protein N' (replication factor Y)